MPLGRSPSPVRITARDARRLAVAAQRLVGASRATRTGILEVIRDIGYLQFDPINVVARNPQLVLWSRIGRYDPALPEGLLPKRELSGTVPFIVPASDFPVHAAPMRAYRLPPTP